MGKALFNDFKISAAVLGLSECRRISILSGDVSKKDMKCENIILKKCHRRILILSLHLGEYVGLS